jgi:CelD/BcsL family acetyltransferase involved in cellulose biosynthesis
MVAIPIFEEQTGGAAAAMMANLAGLELDVPALAQFEGFALSSPQRRLAVYPASAGFELAEELEYLSWRSVESNVFFNPRFLAPAMPRLDDREIRFAALRDETDMKSRLRFVMPFSIEKAGFGIGPSIIRCWSNPFSPLGTPLIDRDDPVGVVEDVLEILSRKHLKMPDVLVIPDIAANGAAASTIRTAAIGRNLTVISTNPIERPILKTGAEPEDYLRAAMTAHHVRGYRRMLRRLSEHGEVTFHEFREPADVRRRTEEFLALETRGWKGRERSAMSIDRYRAAFAREALYMLAERDMCRIHTLDLNGKAIASLVVLREGSTAYTWKTAYDETFAKYSPGALLMLDVTTKLLDDINIERVDSLAVPDHPVMSRMWKEREPMVSLVIGLTPAADRAARQAASQIDLYKKSQQVARVVRDRVLSLTRRS